ncbi:MAG: hypothetical protein M1833_004004 [Piccolia ochrophora]|nr:MAG: hypothetical protein M1833_004004 [Piccolia ochrophora]
MPPVKNYSFSTPPPTPTHALLSFPTPPILLVTLNRPKSLNCIDTKGHVELDAVWQWFDREPSLRVAVFTGTGTAFCAGADLKEWSASKTASPTTTRTSQPPSGFGGLSNRSGLKPIICAVNGACLGGGFEMALNTDMILCTPTATFALPEVRVGVAALAGALPRLPLAIGRQRAMEMALTGRTISAVEMERWGVVNRIVEGKGREVVDEAIKVAKTIAGNSPDAVLMSRAGIKAGWEGKGGVVEEAVRLREGWEEWLGRGENMKEGLKAWVARRPPKWVDSKL